MAFAASIGRAVACWRELLYVYYIILSVATKNAGLLAAAMLSREDKTGEGISLGGDAMLVTSRGYARCILYSNRFPAHGSKIW